MRLDSKFVRVFILALLLPSGCVSMRYDDANCPPHAHPHPAAVPQVAETISPEPFPDLEPTPAKTPEPVVIPEVPEVAIAEELPAPQLEEPCESPAMVAAIVETEDCEPKKTLLPNLRGRLHGLFHWPRHEPAMPPQIPPRPKFFPVPSRPVFAQPVIYQQEMPGQLPSHSGNPIPVPPPADIEPGPSDREAGMPAPLPQSLRIARPLSEDTARPLNATEEIAPSADYQISLEYGP
ncbi:hypothetical protein DTL42_17510 [Bremerella cremea]|uniref:Uncharacterized protein n=1 Tax=Bremerella cremea TaxID=1031537 RepID=A0A368KNC0_9BACT|nr:hypothetical protein [Bremerella cremea]RCS44715.1 hypothetical protein DTL42_17510 [Bremerella cremea]